MTPATNMPQITKIATPGHYSQKVDLSDYPNMEELVKAAENNIPKAALTLATVFRNGFTIKNHQFIQISEPDFMNARKWHEKAARAGILESQYALATFRIKGLAGYTKMPKEAWKIIKQLSDKGYGNASADYAMYQFKLYLNASNTESKNKFLKAILAYSKKAITENCSSPEPFNNLGIAYTQGWFGDKNEKLGLEYTKEAAARGHKYAQLSLLLRNQDEQNTKSGATFNTPASTNTAANATGSAAATSPVVNAANPTGGLLLQYNSTNSNAAPNTAAATQQTSIVSGSTPAADNTAKKYQL